MRDDQETFLQQQRDVIIQQVLETIQRPGGLVSCPRSSHTVTKSSKREKTWSTTARLEKNLHSLVYHSLDESGLDYPHVHNTMHDTRLQSAKVCTKSIEKERSTRKQIILSRREVEGGGCTSSSLVQLGGDQARDENEGEGNQESTLKKNEVLLHSPLRTKSTITCNKRESGGSRRRRHRHSKTLRSSVRTDLVDDDYSGFVDPVDAAFNAVRKKVDLRTLAILDRSKILLGKLKQTSASSKDLNGADGRTSFVEKLRQKHASANEKSFDSGRTHDTVTNRPGSQSDSPQGSKSCEIKPEKHKFDEIGDPTNLGIATVNTTSQKVLKLSADDIRCNLELLQPPLKAPDNDNEWENELARQILTIYATSVKAKALEKERSKSPEKLMDKNQQTREGSADSYEAAGQKKRPGRKSPFSSSFSLPSIGKKAAFKTTQHRISSSPAAVQYSWEPSQLREDGKVIVNLPKVPRPIWYAGTGAVKAVWCALADGFSQLRPQHPDGERSGSRVASVSVCDHRLCEEVRQLEAKKNFAQCITTLESLLVALVRARGVNELETKLWKQLVVTCNAFASRCIDYQKFPAGLQLMKLAEHLIDNSILVDSTMRMELLAYLYDTYAHYYYKRRKPHAGLQYILKAHEIHSRQSSWSHLAKCRLHIANLLSFQIKHAEAMRYMASILEMIEENKLEEATEGGAGSGSAQKLCLAAVCYNNLAVEQLHMREFEAASVSSANAQRLAKLCLSYSNRWLSQFQATSDCAALAIATLMEDTNANEGPLADCRGLSSAED
ncbi:unnamed protein product [Phytophthora lilii]|uniref:Unnamed protein product n=1 Tax=Phytophthora lilii TaxID=2077276 RepID=A0A9W6WVZ7_9STRA|nr:unnamed protein product [Phytophthora lilii]